MANKATSGDRQWTAGLAAGLEALEAAGRDGPASDRRRQTLQRSPIPIRRRRQMPCRPAARPRWRGLSASILQRLLIGRLWGIPDDEATVRVVHHDAAAAVRAADEAGGTAVISNPVAAQDVRAVAADGERVPRKLTSFGPKPRTGLVIRTFDQA